MANAAGRLAEAYTGPSKTTHLRFSYSVRGEVADTWQKSPSSGGYHNLHQTNWAKRTREHSHPLVDGQRPRHDLSRLDV